MRAVCIFAFAVSAIGVQGSAIRENKVLGGTDVPLGQYPFHVSFRNYEKHHCSGTIINENWVLTTGSCIYYGSDTDRDVYVGDNELSGTIGQVYSVSELIVHEDFVPYSHVNDIGLIKVSTPIIMNENVQPVALPAQGQSTPPNSKATVIGWGYNHTAGVFYDNILQEVSVSTISDFDCNATMPEGVSELNICAEVPGGGIGLCVVDEGGPLLFKGEQIGIAYWFEQRCLNTYPDVYTEVAHFIDWINSKINPAL